MTELFAVDAAGHPTPAAVRRAGYSALIQYLVGYSMPAWMPAACTNAGLPLISAYELTAEAALGGASQGAKDAGVAVAAARAYGQPSGSAIYAAVDFQPVYTQRTAVKAYARAWHAGVHGEGFLSGLYGGDGTINEVRGLVDLLWQTYAWSSGDIAAGLALYQSKPVIVDGVSCDLDEIVSTPGAWTLDGPVHLFDPPDPPHPPEDTMAPLLVIAAGHANGKTGPEGQFLVNLTTLTKVGIPDGADLAKLQEPPVTAKPAGLDAAFVDAIPHV